MQEETEILIVKMSDFIVLQEYNPALKIESAIRSKKGLNDSNQSRSISVEMVNKTRSSLIGKKR